MSWLPLSLDDLEEHCYLINEDPSIELGICSRELTFELEDIEIEQNVSLLYEQSTGAVVWNATREFCRMALEKNSPVRKIVENSSVIELGCGTGALARVLSSVTGACLATDQRPLLKLARRNCQDAGNVQVVEYDWELNNFQYSCPKESIIIACDTIYNHFLIDPFVDALQTVWENVGCSCALIAVQARDREVLHEALKKLATNYSVSYIELPKSCMLYRLLPLPSATNSE